MTSTALMAPAPKVDKRPWPGNGPEGDVVTWGEMAKRIQDGMRMPELKAMSGGIIKAAGSPDSARGRVEALRAYVRKEVNYAPDAPMTESIQHAKHSLCLPGVLCIPLGDCDDLVVALGSLIGAAGIDVRILALDYGPNVQKHVLLEFQDDGGRWLTVDPSPPYPPIGYRPGSAKATVIDPLDPKLVPTGYALGAFVGVGANPPTAIPYQNVALPATAHTGLRYRLGLVLTFTADPTDSYRARVESALYFEQQGWAVESLDPDGPAQSVPNAGWVQNWILQGIATQEIALTNTSNVQYVVVGVQSASPTTSPTPDAPIVVASPTTQPTNISFATAAGVAVGIGVVGGLGWYLWKRSQRVA